MKQNAAALFARALSMLTDRRLAMTLNRPNSTSQWVSARMAPRDMTTLVRRANDRFEYLKSRGLAKEHRWTVRFSTLKKPYINLLNEERNQRKARGKKRVRGVPKVKEEL